MSKFLIEFLKNPKTIGAVSPSSKYLAEKMIDGVDFTKAKCIVEYGPGTGIFTEKIIARKSEDAILILLEKNPEFCNKLEGLYGHKKNVKIVNDGAENLKKYLNQFNIEKIDYIISGLPFTVLPKNITKEILTNTKEVFKEGGEFITFQYSMIKAGVFKEYFNEIDEKRVVLNLPPAYVLRCRVN